MRNDRSVATLLMVALLAGCGTDAPEDGDAPAPTPDAATQPAPPTMAEIAEGLVYGIYDEPVRLTDGHYEGPPFTEDSAIRPTVDLGQRLIAYGDIDGDGVPESAVLLEENSGGTGHFSYLAVFRTTPDGAVANDAAWLEDRIQVRSLEAEGDHYVVEAVAGGPGDAACCPTTKTRFVVTMDGDSLAVQSTQSGRVGLADLAGTTWRLERFAQDDPAPSEPSVTLEVAADGRISGTAGCNVYQGQVTSDPEMKSFEPGPIAVTQRMCAPAAMEVEGRFLRLLGSVTGYSFSQGQLLLSSVDDQGYRAMFFDPGE